jgi:hypothetical protein
MSPYATRRRAEQFAAVADGQSPGGAYDGRYDDLLQLVGALRAVPEPVARPEFVADLRSRLVAEVAVTPVVAAAEADRLRLRPDDPGRVRNPRERRLAVALGSFALVGATATMAVVAQSALPGDTLYPLKRGIENAHAGISVGDDGKGSTVLANASTRLSEIEQLARDGRGADHPAAVSDTLNDFTEQASEASDLLLASYADEGDPAQVAKVHTFTASSMVSLADLDGQLPESAEDEWVHAVTTLMRIDDQAKLACPSCSGTDLTTVAPTLPTIGTGYGTNVLPAINLPDIVLPTGLVLPSVDASELPPGSVTKPSPTVGLPSGRPTAGSTPSVDPTGLPTVLPTGGQPTTAPTSGATGGLPTAVPTTVLAILPSVDLTQLINNLTAGPTILIVLPSVDVSQLLGGVGSALPTAITDPLGGLLGGS